MATITPVTTSDAGRITCTWSSMSAGDVGGSVEIYAYPALTIQSDASSGSVVVIQGSNDNSKWYTVGTPQNPGLADFSPDAVTSPRYLRPSVSSSSTFVEVVAVGHKFFAGI